MEFKILEDVVRALLTPTAPLIFMAAGADDDFSDDRKISIRGESSSAGEISFRPTKDKSVNLVKIKVQIANDTGDKDVAEPVTSTVRTVPGDDAYKIERKSNDEITITGQRQHARLPY